MGTQANISAKIMIESYDLPMTVEEFQSTSKAMTVELMSSAKLLPGIHLKFLIFVFFNNQTKSHIGAERLIRHLHTTDVPFCLATSSSQELTEIKISQHKDLFSLFHHKVMGTSDPEVKNGKPAPDIFLIAANRFDNPPNPKDVSIRDFIFTIIKIKNI